MDPQLIINLFIQVPALGVVVYLVLHFLKYIEKMRHEDREFVANLVVDYKTALKTCESTIHENTKAVQTFNDNVREGNHLCPMTRKDRDAV